MGKGREELAMRYADSLLADGEVVVRRARQHWFSLVVDGRRGWLLALGGIVVLVLGLWVRGSNTEGFAATVGQLLALVALAALVVGLVLFGLQVWRWTSQDYLVTNRRVMKVEGVLNKRSMDSSLEKINDAVLDQSMIGRMFDYGDLDILTAAEVAVDKFRMLKSATEFKRAMLDQKYALESEPHWPTPPVRTGAAAQGTQGYQQPAVQQPYAAQPPAAGYAPPAAAPSHPQAGDSTAVTQTLARLADLRDRGAITPAEYETKKAELLRRL
jgi:hypothetical protein